MQDSILPFLDSSYMVAISSPSLGSVLQFPSHWVSKMQFLLDYSLHPASQWCPSLTSGRQMSRAQHTNKLLELCFAYILGSPHTTLPFGLQPSWNVCVFSGWHFFKEDSFVTRSLCNYYTSPWKFFFLVDCLVNSSYCFSGGLKYNKELPSGPPLPPKGNLFKE